MRFNSFKYFPQHREVQQLTSAYKSEYQNDSRESSLAIALNAVGKTNK